MSNHHTKISQFLSFVLRHQPDAIGITLDIEGWVDIAILIDAAGRNGKPLDLAVIRDVVATSDNCQPTCRVTSNNFLNNFRVIALRIEPDLILQHPVSGGT
jgi:hypothetical protein